MHTRSQVDVLTCTFLVLMSLLCSTDIAALSHHKYSRFLRLLLSTSSGVSLSLLHLYCSLLRQRHSSVSIHYEQCRAWNSSQPLAIFWPNSIWPSKSYLLGHIYCTFPMEKPLIVYSNVPAFKEWPTNFKLLFQALQWTPPLIIQLTCAETVIYSDNSPWHEPLQIPNMAKQ